MRSPYAAAMRLQTPHELLRNAVVDDPARPLLTWYGPDAARVELSTTTTDNWVAKTANLLRDELAAGPGSRVRVDLPTHWLGPVWLLASWAVGAAVVLQGAETAAETGAETGAEPDVAVAHADAEPAPGAADLVIVPRSPLAMPDPATPRVPPGAIDFATDIRAQGDRFLPGPAPAPDAVALEVAGTSLTYAELADLDAEGLAAGDRVLTTARLDGLRAVHLGLLAPLRARAGVLLCTAEHVTDDLLAAEHVTHVVEHDEVRPISR